MIELSPFVLPDGSPVNRTAPRPMELRNANYNAQFDWDTVLYDVYRSGKYVVMQGPPLFNMEQMFLSGVKEKYSANYIKRHRAFDLWISEANSEIDLKTALGDVKLSIQPDENNRFSGKRVLLTLSKDNDMLWIADWIRFHIAYHQCDAVLFYNNNSRKYTSSELSEYLKSTFPNIPVVVVDWHYKYGAQGGVSGGVDGQSAPWDSDFCQTGVLQHARFRFLQKASSVLNCDIDELVVSDGNPYSIFEYAEKSLLGTVYFEGVWISSTTPSSEQPLQRRHGDYFYFDLDHTAKCPFKWCTRPSRNSRRFNTWTAHEITNMPRRMVLNKQVRYRHFKAISDNWKWERDKRSAFPLEAHEKDVQLENALKTHGFQNHMAIGD